MISLDATVRDNTTKGQLSSIRDGGNVPAIIYGGKGENEKISISKKILKATIEKENFLSNIISISVNGKNQNVLPREVVYDVLTDEPIHVDFLRVVPGVKIRIEVPVEFINHEKSPGLKRGGVLNIVRRKVELKCPSEKIPEKPAEAEAAEGAEAEAAEGGDKPAEGGDKPAEGDKKEAAPAEKK